MKVIKILRDRIQIRTSRNATLSVRINDLFWISDQLASLVVSVTSLTDSDVESMMDEDEYILPGDSAKVIECAVIGSLKDGCFVKAIDQYPSMDAEIGKIGAKEFAGMISGHTASGFPIGRYMEYDVPAWVDGNKLFQRHSCIVGNTGSGKSETVAKILQETVKLPGANMILFDIHGEYGRLSFADNIQIGTDLPFPIWLFGFSDMVANILKIREESSGVIMAALRKCYTKVCPDDREDRPAYFDYDRLTDEIFAMNDECTMTGEVYKSGSRAGEAKTVKGDFNGKLTNCVNILKAKRKDKRYAFLFDDHDGPAYLEYMINRLMGGDKPVKNIDLSDIPHDVAIPIIGVITKLVYDIQRSAGQEAKPVVLICDEAHVYIPNNLQLSASERRMVEIFENVAKEGRKFGITLFVASQRPSELNTTIMAQCANFIVGKLNNENDKSMIKGMLPDGSDEIIDSTTMFAPGDVMIVGDAASIPLKIHVDLARERPMSRTIDFWDMWGTSGRIKNYGDYVKRYMSDGVDMDGNAERLIK